MTTSSTTPAKTPVDVAIIGGGIVGLIIAIGLLQREFDVKIYEQASELHEIGAGIAFTANAQRCMELVDPRILAAMKKVANKNPNDYYQYVDGYKKDIDNAQDISEKLLFKIYAGDTGFDGCHRAHFVNELLKLIPPGVICFRKRLESFEDEEHKRVLLRFQDGTSTEADILIGCDGIKSRVRQNMFGPQNPISHAHYTHKAAYRGLIPMDVAKAALGSELPYNQCMHMGPKSHVLNFPVAMHTMMNVVAFVEDPDPWPSEGKMDAAASRDEVVAAFSDWGPTVRKIMDLLPEKLTKWAIFDMHDHPAPTYAAGRICLAGDAAHSSSPHQGAGAGFGVEDALAVAELLTEAKHMLQDAGTSRQAIITASLSAYSTARYDRSQWLVRSSREVCDIYEFAYATTSKDPERCKTEIETRAHKIWNFDIEQMLRDAKKDFHRRIMAVTSN